MKRCTPLLIAISNRVREFCGVVAIISKRFGNRLRNSDRSRKMNDLRNPILRDQRRNSPLIPDVLNENRNSGWYCPFEARRKIIDHDGLFATISEFVHHVAPNVAGTSGDKDRHCYLPYSLWKRPSTCLKLRNKLPFRRVIKAYAKDNT